MLFTPRNGMKISWIGWNATLTCNIVTTTDLVTLPVVVNILKRNQLRLSAEVGQNILKILKINNYQNCVITQPRASPSWTASPWLWWRSSSWRSPRWWRKASPQYQHGTWRTRSQCACCGEPKRGHLRTLSLSKIIQRREKLALEQVLVDQRKIQ